MSVKQVILLSVLGANGAWFLGDLSALTGPTAQQPANSPTSIRSSARRHCYPATVRVALAPGETDQYTVFGELCLPPVKDGRTPTVHLAVHGATYSHLYWRWPYQPET